MNAINEYLELYPNSANVDEAYNYIGKMFLTTKNYQGAIESFENIDKFVVGLLLVPDGVDFIN